MTATVTNFAVESRRRKVDRLCATLRDAVSAGLELGDVAAWEEHTWATAASVAGVNMPSRETRQLVVLRLEMQGRAR